MTDNHDPLSQLWQEQKVEKPDLEAISKKWRSIKIKQRLYVFLDLSSVIFCVVILMFLNDKLSTFSRLMFICMTLISAIWVIYNTWLRRFSLGGTELSTDGYLLRLKKQLNNSITIATMCKHSVWPILAFIILHEVGMAYFYGIDGEKFTRKILILGVLHGVLMPATWVWADRRAKRFKRELAALNDLLGQNK